MKTHKQQRLSSPYLYDPYARSYKFILFQNMVYHQANKKSVKGLMQKNHSTYASTRRSSRSQSRQNNNNINVQKMEILKRNQDIKNYKKSYSYDSKNKLINSSQSQRKRATPDTNLNSPLQIQKKIATLKNNNKKANTKNSQKNTKNRRKRQFSSCISLPQNNHKAAKRLQFQITKQNNRFANKLLSTSCRVVSRSLAIKDFKSHQKYSSFRRHYIGSHIKDLLIIPKLGQMAPSLQKHKRIGSLFMNKQNNQICIRKKMGYN